MLVILCLAALGVTTAEAQQAPAKPVEAELLSRISARTAAPGDTVYAIVAEDWTGSGCRLRRGATLQGIVRSSVPHSRHSRSELAIAFDRAECGDSGLQPFRLILHAVSSADDGNGEVPADLPNVAARSAEATSLRPIAQRVDMPFSVKTGEVHGIKGLKLTVATDADHISILTRSGVDVQLDASTRLLLLPVRTAVRNELPVPGSTAAAALLEDSPITVLPTSGEDLDNCVTRGCAPEAAADAPPAAASAEASMRQVYDASIPLRSLGYVPRINKELLAPTEDDALAWLGPRELLIAFNPHALVPRQGDGDWGHTVRVIRAALVDVSTHTVERTLEWRLPDMNQFLWLLPGNRVLVHVENELRVYGPGLRVEKRISLAGPLAFARISPNGKVIALGVKRERHTADLHARLAAIIGKDPPEDMQVLMLNDRFDTIGTAMSSSDRVAPVLIDEGQVKAVPAGGHGGREDRHCALQLRTWSGQTRSVARFQSACAPGVSSLPPDLLFLVTCNRLNGARSYRVLRPDGSTLLHGDSFLRELGHAASGGGAPGMFAVRIFMADEPVMPGEPFHATDLQSAELVLYRSEDGKRLFSVRAKDPAASLGGYAISPAGEVAILTEDDVNVYKAPVN